jgi:predicted ArsR family transcriptional regulator
MMLPEIRDLIKHQWRPILEELKHAGGLPVSELARAIGGSYMAVKNHCDELTQAGYLLRTRLPRTEVGRPEIFYSLAAKADGLFSQAGVDFTLELLDELKLMYGESAPEKLLFQHFRKRREHLAKMLDKCPTPAAKAAKLAALRDKDGGVSRYECQPGQPLRIVECHNPLQRIFERYPRAAAMELRMLEELLDTRVTRRELPGGRESPPRVVFELA